MMTMLARTGSLMLSALAALLVAALALLLEVSRPGPAAPSGASETVVLIPRGASVTRIARALEAEGVVHSALSFRIAAEVFAPGRGLQAGEYAIPDRASVREVVAMLADGRAILHSVTIPEGRTSAQVIDILAESEALVGPLPAVPPEGSLLPETYRVPRGSERALLLRQMMEAQQELMEELWPKRAEDLPFDTPEEAIILASIVERETGVPDERPRVAAVFVNRLRRGMRLESDPTIIYGISQGRPLGRGLYRSEIDRPTPYNTYVISGLPPTPIANPGREAIAAVLNPPKTKDLFFVALSPDNPRDGHVFSETYAEHQRAVARLRAAERAAR